MPLDYLHNHKDFADLIRIVAVDMDITPTLVEKDYWIMHCLYGLQKFNWRFELKGGTSLSKGFGIINRFSEDIDIRIDPPKNLGVYTGRNQNKSKHIESRKRFYDWLAMTIRIDGIYKVERDIAFDDKKFRSGGIKLYYPEVTSMESDLKTGVLLEVGFDDVTPNQPKDISSWAYERASRMVAVIDNRAPAVLCYSPGYTLVEKLQAISTKFRSQRSTGQFPQNFLRHYYDVYCLLNDISVQEFIGSQAYLLHKDKRFGSEHPVITENEAFLLSDSTIFNLYEKAYEGTKSLYYRDRPSFSNIMKQIKEFAPHL